MKDIEKKRITIHGKVSCHFKDLNKIRGLAMELGVIPGSQPNGKILELLFAHGCEVFFSELEDLKVTKVQE